tara:strand:- start:877 stop:1023 length:147 start_codon:yes stop_codon:yes gene_type:complete
MRDVEHGKQLKSASPCQQPEIAPFAVKIGPRGSGENRGCGTGSVLKKS